MPRGSSRQQIDWDLEDNPDVLEIVLCVTRETALAWRVFDPEEQNESDAVWMAMSTARQYRERGRVKRFMSYDFKVPVWVARESGWI